MNELKFTRRALIAGVGSVAVATNLALPALAQDSGRAQQFVDELCNAVESINLGAFSEAQREAGVGELMRGAFAVSRIAGLAAGRHKRRMTPDQNATFEQAFGSYFVKRQVDFFTNDLGATFETGPARFLNSESSGWNTYEVPVHMTLTSGTVVPITLHLAENEYQFQIFEMQIDGVSIVTRFRQEFSSLMSQNGNNIDAVIAHYYSAL